MRPFRPQSPLTRQACRGCFAALALLLSLIAFMPTGLAQGEAGNQPTGTDATYKLGPGDQIEIEVFNQEDLSGEYVLDGSGQFSMPLIGLVDAAGLTGTELERLLISRYRPDFLVNPRIYVRINFYRPYYLMGEVQSTGSFAFVEGMTYLAAIARAGGYSYRAKKGVVYVVRAGDNTREELRLDVNEMVQPGDIIRIAERIF
jgi:polysaccharide export outer membrane protein